MKKRTLIAASLLLLALLLIPWTAAEYRTEHTVTVTADGTQIPAVSCGAERQLTVQTVHEVPDPVSAVRNRPPCEVEAGGVLHVYLDGVPVSAEGMAIPADGMAEPLSTDGNGLLLPMQEGDYTVVVCAVSGHGRYYAAVPVRCTASETVFY